MPKDTYVVQYDDATELYLVTFNPVLANCEWGTKDNPNILVWETLEDAQGIAAMIDGGTVGTVKPH